PITTSTLSLHDALPISIPAGGRTNVTVQTLQAGATGRTALYKFFMTNDGRWAAPMESLLLSFHVAGGAFVSSTIPASANTTSTRSEEHTSEFQSPDHLV